jgi:hypothetical protein
MKYLANIISKSKIEVSSFFKVTDNILDVDLTIPTLIIGWSEVKILYPDQDILNKQINEKIRWTFSKREKRYQYEEDITNFINEIAENLDKTVNYRFFNYILATQSRRDNFFSYVTSGRCSIYYNDKFMYIYNANDNITLGISLVDLRYAGINVKEFIVSLNSPDNIFCDNFKCIDSNSFSLIKDNIKNIAYLNYLRNL